MVKLYIGDCLKVLPNLAPEFFSLTITDPPYQSLDRHRAVGTTTRLKESKSSSNPWFETFPNTSYFQLFKELYRVHAQNSHLYCFCDSETEAVILSGRNPYNEKLDLDLQEFLAADPETRWNTPAERWTVWPALTWLKTKRRVDDMLFSVEEETTQDDIRAGMGYHWRRAEERILFLEKGKRKLNFLGWPNVLVAPRAGRDEFPTQKPEQVIENLILNSTQPGEWILDPFCGSGIVGEVAARTGRNAILIEKNPTKWLLDRFPNIEG